jgi:hypothetical protein
MVFFECDGGAGDIERTAKAISRMYDERRAQELMFLREAEHHACAPSDVLSLECFAVI